MSSPKYDLVIYGATGFTGRLAATYVAERYSSTLKWALAGRNAAKLEALRGELGVDMPIIVADASDVDAVASMVSNARVIANFAGTPFIDKALPIVKCCVESGTHYVDITGETPLQRASYDQYHKQALKTRSLIIHNCGYDSVPSDLGAMMAAKAMKDRHNQQCSRIRLVARDSLGGVSGGTIETALTLAFSSTAKSLPGVRAAAAKGKYALDPEGGTGGPDTADGAAGVYEYDAVAGTWVAPFIMAGVNAPVVRKTNALLAYAYGPLMSYSEVNAAPSRWACLGQTGALAVGGLLLALPPTRFLLRKTLLPAPGQGPSETLRNTGHFHSEVYAVGETPLPNRDAPPVTRAHIRSGDAGDPGYKATARMCVESALCLALERDRCEAAGGVLTPASAMGQCLIDRLNASGMQLTVDADCDDRQ